MTELATNDNVDASRIVAYLTRQRDWYCFNERQIAESDFGQAMSWWTKGASS